MKYVLASILLSCITLQSTNAGYSGNSWVGFDTRSAAEKKIFINRGGNITIRMDYNRTDTSGFIDPYIHLFFVPTNFKLTWKPIQCELVKTHHLMCDGLRLQPNQKHTFYATFQAINGNTLSEFKYNISNSSKLRAFSSNAQTLTVRVQ